MGVGRCGVGGSVGLGVGGDKNFLGYESAAIIFESWLVGDSAVPVADFTGDRHSS